MRPLSARCHLSLGRLYRRTGEPQRTRAHLSAAASLLREMNMCFWLEQAEGRVDDDVFRGRHLGQLNARAILSAPVLGTPSGRSPMHPAAFRSAIILAVMRPMSSGSIRQESTSSPLTRTVPGPRSPSSQPCLVPLDVPALPRRSPAPATPAAQTDHHAAVGRKLERLRGHKLTYVDASTLVFLGELRIADVGDRPRSRARGGAGDARRPIATAGGRALRMGETGLWLFPRTGRPSTQRGGAGMAGRPGADVRSPAPRDSLTAPAQPPSSHGCGVACLTRAFTQS
jgi:hypothetical protein